MSSSSYLRASGSLALHFQISDLVGDRYRVIAPQIWEDTKPELPPACEYPNATAKRYGKVYHRQLHIPRVYDICPLPEGDLLLLDNIPIDQKGELLPALSSMWGQTTALRQLYWFWQILDLWEDLGSIKAISSILLLENIRVDDWRLRIMELIEDPEDMEITFKNVAQSWRSLSTRSARPIREPLEALLEEMEEPDAKLEAIQKQLNTLLIEQSSQQLLRIKVAAATDKGQEPEINEDSYYPTPEDFKSTKADKTPLTDHLLMVCDGIAGHSGGEVASQLAIQSLKLQLSGLLKELLEFDGLLHPHVVQQQLAAYIRVANNVITNRNDQQGRAARDRMATTLVLALQLPQKFDEDDTGIGNSHELYIAHVGDSRAYWITENQCLCLTVDDDVVTREVRAGRSIYRHAQQRPDAEAITQALGTREGDLLHPNIQRFILDGDGLLLVCSDGLSDRHFLEEHWQTFAPVIIQERLTPEMMLQALMKQAVETNTQDNISVAIAFYGIRPQHPVVINAGQLQTIEQPEELIFESLPLPNHETPKTPEDIEEAEFSEITDEKSQLPQIALIAVGLVIILAIAALAALGINRLMRRDSLPTPSTPSELEQPTELNPEGIIEPAPETAPTPSEAEPPTEPNPEGTIEPAPETAPTPSDAEPPTEPE